MLKIPLSNGIVSLVGQVDRFRGAWASGTRVPPDRLARLKDAAKVHSVAASCRLTGIRVTDSEVAELLRGEACPVREGREIFGYAEAIDRSLPPVLSTDDLREFQPVLMGLPGNPPTKVGWREAPIHLEAFDEAGKALGRVFQTLPPRMIPEKIEELVNWLEIELRSDRQHPVLVVAAFTLAFMAISPFARGNGRMARLLAVHLLRRAGYTHMSYSSFERIIEETRERYYDAFDTSETRLWTGEGDLTPWLEFFLEALKLQTERLSRKLDIERIALDLSPLQRSIVDTVREHGTANAVLLIASTGANRNTLKDNLRRLVERNVLERVGKRRGTFYRLPTGEPEPVPENEPR